MTTINYASANAGASGITYYNLVRDCSIMESKNHEHTDRNGHVKGYIINYEVTSAAGQILNFTTAPNSWKMRNSFRKFHAYRNAMFENAGITDQEKGMYGHTIRPFLDNTHRVEEAASGDIGVPFVWNGATGTSTTGGEWTYSELSTVPLYLEAGPDMKDSLLKVSDSWPVMILGANIAGTAEDKTSGMYDAVGMIHSYNLDRMEVVTPGDDSTITGPNNPLAALAASGNQAAGDILRISEDQEKELPPYSLADKGDSVYAVSQSVSKMPTTLGVVRGSCFVPAGLLGVHQSEAGGYLLNVQVVGVVLCKDMA